MKTADLLKTVSANNALMAENTQKVFEAGKAQSGGDFDETQLPQYYLSAINAWYNATFPDGYEFKLRVKNVPDNMTSAFMYAKGVKTVTLSCDSIGSTGWLQTFRGCTSVEVVDITNFNVSPTIIQHFANSATKLVLILGEIDMSNCTNAASAFLNTSALEEIRFKEGTISIALDFKSCTKLSDESYDSIMQGLSSTATGQTLTLTKYATVKATYDAKYGEGAWDILAASKTNWTIAYS